MVAEIPVHLRADEYPYDPGSTQGQCALPACLVTALLAGALVAAVEAGPRQDLAFLRMVSIGDTTAAKAMLDRDPGLLRGAAGLPRWNALQRAAADHDAHMVRFLLRQHADLEAADNEGARPLHLAVRPSAETTDGERAARVEVQGALLAAGARVTATDASGATPLHWAALHGDLEFARLLLEHGADIQAREPGEGMTPLHVAAAGGDTDLVKLLLERGADAGARDRAGRRPLDVARMSNCAEAADVLRHHTAGGTGRAGSGDGGRAPRPMESRPGVGECCSPERPQSIA